MADYPALGFDPARGNVGTVRELAKQMTDTGGYAREAHRVLKSVQDKKDVWTGDAAKAFRDKLGDLPGYLDDAHVSLEDAGKALTSWSDRLEAHQRRARELEQQAKQAIAAAEQADAAARTASAKADTPIAYNANDPAAAQSAQQQAQANAEAVDQANQAAGAAWAKVDDIRRQAQDLRDRWEDDAGVCADALNRAAERAPEKGFFESIGDAFSSAGDWVMNNLGAIGDVAGIVSAVAGALSFIPVLAPVTGPIALAAGGVALLAHGGEMVKEGKWTEPSAWVGLGTDMLGVLPGVGAVSKGMSAATDSLQMVDGLSTAATTGGRVILQEAGDVAKPAKLFTSLGNKVADTIGGNPDTIAKATQNTLNLGAQAPVAADLIVGNDTTKTAKDATGYAAGAVASGQSVGEWGKAATGIVGLGNSLSNFARALR
ncbi:hypothetical protein HFP15_08875 [Amycolatopsis sp. K13G38]|uniref:WXG100 family type VII secretion target n=1 Tax=Amycolatopsis acididurans TaxID=2724524 RepID=A0ABX1IZP1_9PSEU|nr:hypothetical protein [Amycolatopsis acididurans]NKQ52992.1 hypothetical protein [Amycolatopsis acididurans]